MLIDGPQLKTSKTCTSAGVFLNSWGRECQTFHTNRTWLRDIISLGPQSADSDNGSNPKTITIHNIYQQRHGNGTNDNPLISYEIQ